MKRAELNGILRIEIRLNDRPIAQLVHDLTGNYLADIEVDSEFQRQGIATALWKVAKAISPGARHSNVRSLSGDVWARSLNEALPESLMIDERCEKSLSELD